MPIGIEADILPDFNRTLQVTTLPAAVRFHIIYCASPRRPPSLEALQKVLVVWSVSRGGRDKMSAGMREHVRISKDGEEFPAHVGGNHAVRQAEHVHGRHLQRRRVEPEERGAKRDKVEAAGPGRLGGRGGEGSGRPDLRCSAQALRKPATRMAKRKPKSGSARDSCSAHSMATKAAPWLKPRTPSNGPSSRAARRSAATLSSRPALSSQRCCALKVRAAGSENHQPRDSRSPSQVPPTLSWAAI